MKFARYLEDTQTPEWKRAYIDYRKLKKCITQIKNTQQPTSSWLQSPKSLKSSPAPKPPDSLQSSSGFQSSPQPSHQHSDRLSPRSHVNYGSLDHTPPLNGGREGSPPPMELPPPAKSVPSLQRSLSLRETNVPPKPSSANLRPSFHRTQSFPDSPRISPRSGPTRHFSLANFRKLGSMRATPTVPEGANLTEILLTLSPSELSFFQVLDQELHKVETFYIERERDATILSSMLKEQLRELQDHRRLFYASQPDTGTHWPFGPEIRNTLKRLIPGAKPETTQPVAPPNSPRRSRERSVESLASLDPEEYHHNKKKLKKAILEHYRGLELLNNYRILNLTGFRKALKKFEKMTRIPAQRPYMSEKVEACAFSSDIRIMEMIKDVEDLYAERFSNGDRKQARSRLRATMQSKTHHAKSFRAGTYIGLALPALIQGIYFSFQPETRAAIPAWEALLQIYGAFFVLVIFALLITFNVLGWSRARINYVFIFELDVRTAMDPREYAEVPAILFATLCYAFWISFARQGVVAPTTWPLGIYFITAAVMEGEIEPWFRLAWLVFALLFILCPLPYFVRPSRWWLVRKAGKLLASGKGRVEFTDFWMGDQFCSLPFTLSSLWTFGCAYQNDWRADSWDKCGLSNRWSVPFVLSAIPSFLRFVQCVKRYADSGLYTHMINGGKYISSILYYLFYFLWRHHGAHLNGSPLVLFCFFSTIMSIYTISWDLLMDWSVLKPSAPHKFLRPELGYSNYISAYYFAIFTNIVIRFVWVFYIPFPSGLSIPIRSFIFALLEVFRRVQWNFFRLENEHLGNMDQYRVTREVPLPYRFHDQDDGDEDDELEDDGLEGKSSSPRRKRRAKHSVHLPKVTVTNTVQQGNV